MASDAFLMSGEASPFRPAQACTVTRGPHHADPGSYLVADATVRDGSVAVRLALWRCAACGTAMAGVGLVSGTPDGSRESRAPIDAQEFTWLEEKIPEVTRGHGDRAFHHEHVGGPV